MDRELREVALAQGGVVTYAQALAAGHTRAQIRTELRRGRWRKLRRGLYVAADVSQTCSQDPVAAHALRTAAAVLSSGSEVWAAGPSAAALLGLETLTRPPALVVLSRDRGDTQPGRAPRHGNRSGSTCRLASFTGADEIVTVGALRCTSPGRTAVDLARSTAGRGGVVAADSAARAFGVTGEQLREIAGRQRGWPYSRRVETALHRMDEGSESVLETLGRLALPPEWPQPLTQAWVGEYRPEYRVDFLVPELWIAGEADGRLKYGDERALWDEKHRQDRIEDLGWTFVRFGWAESYRRPSELTGRFRAAAARARPGRGRVFPAPMWWQDQRARAQAESRRLAPWWLAL